MSFIERISNTGLAPVRTKLEEFQLSDSGFVLKPRLKATAEVPAYYNDIWRRTDLAEPKEPVVFDHINPAALNDHAWLFKVGSFVIKNTETADVYIPDELENFVPFVQASIDHEFTANGNAFNWRAVLLVDSSLPVVGESYRPHAQGLHGHPPYSNSARFTYSITNSHYYVTSSRNPTGFYTGRIAPDDIDAAGLHIVKRPKYKCDFKPLAGDVSLFTSVHAHESPVENYETDEPRIFTAVIFMHPNSDGEPLRPNPLSSEISRQSTLGNRAIADQLKTRWRQKAIARFGL